MSHTYHIVCLECLEHLWVGQGNPPADSKEDKRYLYSTGQANDPLAIFLFKHANSGLYNTSGSAVHSLVFSDSEPLVVDIAFDTIKGWIELCSRCGAVPPCEHELAPTDDNE